MKLAGKEYKTIINKSMAVQIYKFVEFAQIFSIVLMGDHIPHEWVSSLVKSLHKNKGDIIVPDNYRGITLLSCLGKLFTSIMNERMTVFINSKQTMSEVQDGFRKGYSTIDQIFTLKCIVELFYVKVESI